MHVLNVAMVKDCQKDGSERFWLPARRRIATPGVSKGQRLARPSPAAILRDASLARWSRGMKFGEDADMSRIKEALT
jgi:hypothetical protein